MDPHNNKTRSFNMSRFKGKDTWSEIIVRKLSHKLGLRFRLYQKILKLKSNLIFKKYQSIIFANGCFLHSHTHKLESVIPKTNENFWTKKRLNTINRDQINYNKLKSNDWRVIVVWECETKKFQF